MVEFRWWTVDGGLRMVDCGWWTVDGGLWMVDCGWWTVDGRLWMVDSGWWIVDGGLWMLEGGPMCQRFVNLVKAVVVKEQWQQLNDLSSNQLMPLGTINQLHRNAR